MITVLTPTYNRAHTLPKLFESLCHQDNYSFEWLIIDDGSGDETNTLISKYLQESPFKIRYIKKTNGGKHSALNIGFKEAKYDWILIVDSDDWLKSNTISFLSNQVPSLGDTYHSISILRVYNNNQVIGNKFPSGLKTYLDRINNEVVGDKADLIKKKALRNFSFPIYENEIFMAESPLFIRLGETGKTKFLNFEGYVCEYLPDGLSDRSVVNRHACVNSTLYVYKNIYQSPLNFKQKSRAAINWWRFRLFKKGIHTKDRLPFIYSPFGLALYLVDKLKYKSL